MKPAVRIALYILFVTGAIVLFVRFRTAYQAAAELSAKAAATTIEGPAADLTTNAAAASPTNDFATAGSGKSASPSPDAKGAGAKATLTAQASAQRSRAFIFLAGFIGCLLGSGLLLAYDVVSYLGDKAGRAVMAEDYLPPTDPVYEQAEEQWAKGNHMDAITLMREYLKRNPNEQHVAIRIAEIYEKDLNNYLAAVLELEEVLTKRLPEEKWGWTAVHLANIYSGKLNQPAKAVAVLERLAREHPKAAAAKKARQRLGLPEPEEGASDPGAQASSTPPQDPAMPKGFSAKK
jgi:TolA-binding protein